MRAHLAVAALAVVVIGLAVTRVEGPAADAVGDGLYAVLIVATVALCAPAARGWVLATVAFAVCAAIELSQLTGLPGALTDAWGPLRYVLGTTFNAVDLVAYALGAVLGAVAVRVLSPRAPTPPGADGGTAR